MELSKVNPNNFIKKVNGSNNSSAVQGVCLLLSGIQINDTGGGSRCSQIALELLRQNYRVIFVNLYPSYEKQQNILTVKENSHLLELYNFNEFDVEENFLKYKYENSFCLVEFPHKSFFPLLLKLKLQSPKVKIVYDSIDNFNTSLGGNWFNKEIDRKIQDLSDVFIASAKTLQLDLMEERKKLVYCIPNAVNTNVFNLNNCIEIPEFRSDILYCGALWGSWFDWNIIRHIANKSNYRITLVGGGCPENIRAEFKDRITFPGLVPQEDLPNYIYNTKTCIIPFKVDDITKYTNPLKVYEYLAINKPVVASDMPELYFLPNTYLVKSPEEFFELCQYCIEQKTIQVDLSQFLYRNSWNYRVKELLEVIENG